MSSSDRGRDDATGTQRDPAAPADSPAPGTDAYANWLDRMQRARARQAAITRNLYTWSNYKSWADQVRDSWQATDGTGARVVFDAGDVRGVIAPWQRALSKKSRRLRGAFHDCEGIWA